MPPVPGLEQHDPSLRAVVISHPHMDHYGLAGNIAAPVIMGEAAWRILAEASFFTGGILPPAPSCFLRHREPATIGPFTITPFLNDHSAFDAYSMLVEATRAHLGRGPSEQQQARHRDEASCKLSRLLGLLKHRAQDFVVALQPSADGGGCVEPRGVAGWLQGRVRCPHTAPAFLRQSGHSGEAFTPYRVQGWRHWVHGPVVAFDPAVPPSEPVRGVRNRSDAMKERGLRSS